MLIYTYIAYLHSRQADGAADKTVMDTVMAESVRDAETAIMERYEPDDPELICLIEGDHADAR